MAKILFLVLVLHHCYHSAAQIVRLPQCNKYAGRFSQVRGRQPISQYNNATLLNKNLDRQRKEATSHLTCTSRCIAIPKCFSTLFSVQNKTCTFYNRRFDNDEMKSSDEDVIFLQPSGKENKKEKNKEEEEEGGEEEGDDIHGFACQSSPCNATKSYCKETCDNKGYTCVCKKGETCSQIDLKCKWQNEKRIEGGDDIGNAKNNSEEECQQFCLEIHNTGQKITYIWYFVTGGVSFCQCKATGTIKPSRNLFSVSKVCKVLNQ